MNTPQTTVTTACVADQKPVQRTYRPKLRFYHANARGTGCAVSMELHPAHDDTDGSIMVCMSNQATIGDLRGPNPKYPRFDWEGSIIVKLDFSDLCRILQVLRGECESLDDGRGLYHTTATASTKIVFRHIVEPFAGYSLEFYRTAKGGGETRTHYVFSPWEALGLAEAIAGSMSVISFGIPVVIPRDTSAYKAANRANRNVSAA